MAENAELAFVKNHLNVIGSLPIQYSDDYQQPPENSLRKIPIIPIDLPEPPEKKVPASTASSGTIAITFKSSKPPRSFVLQAVSPADSISTIKGQLATQPGAPPADAQRLLLRGKALADGKLLQEYNVKSGDVVNVMLRPGFEWDWDTTKVNKPAPTTTTTSATQRKGTETPRDPDGDVKMNLAPDAGSSMKEARSSSRHGRIPSVVLSPSPSSATLPLAEHPSSPIPLTIDDTNIAAVTNNPMQDSYQKKITSPEFWERLRAFLRQEFETDNATNHAFEAFLLGSKGSLTPSEIAKIRDIVGIVGMAGT